VPGPWVQKGRASVEAKTACRTLGMNPDEDIQGVPVQLCVLPRGSK